MKETIARFLKVQKFPFTIKNQNGNIIYWEDSEGFWEKREYDAQGNQIYYENSEGYWVEQEYNSNGNQIYYENSHGYWQKKEYDSNKKEIFYENSEGVILDNRPKPVVEMTLQEVADKLGMDVKSIRIKE